jgi:hypothetical protein
MTPEATTYCSFEAGEAAWRHPPAHNDASAAPLKCHGPACELAGVSGTTLDLPVRIGPVAWARGE